MGSFVGHGRWNDDLAEQIRQEVNSVNDNKVMDGGCVGDDDHPLASGRSFSSVRRSVSRISEL